MVSHTYLRAGAAAAAALSACSCAVCAAKAAATAADEPMAAAAAGRGASWSERFFARAMATGMGSYEAAVEKHKRSSRDFDTRCSTPAAPTLIMPRQCWSMAVHMQDLNSGCCDMCTR